MTPSGRKSTRLMQLTRVFSAPRPTDLTWIAPALSTRKRSCPQANSNSAHQWPEVESVSMNLTRTRKITQSSSSRARKSLQSPSTDRLLPFKRQSARRQISTKQNAQSLKQACGKLTEEEEIQQRVSTLWDQRRLLLKIAKVWAPVPKIVAASVEK